jgi:hypothetical protein
LRQLLTLISGANFGITDRRRDAKQFPLIRERLRVVARRGGDDAAFLLVGR